MHRKTRILSTVGTAAAMVMVALFSNTAFASSPTGTSGVTGANAKTSLIVGLSVADIRTVNAEVAVDEGFFSREHLNVTFVNLQPDAAVSALETNSIQIAETDPPALLRAYDLGHNFKLLTGGQRTSFTLVGNDAFKCSTWKAAFPGPLACLVGHTIGVPTLGDSDQILGEYLMSQAAGCTGGGAKCVTWVEDTNPTLWLPELASGAIDAQVSWGSVLPVYAANHLKVWTVADANVVSPNYGNAGKLVPLNVSNIPVASASILNADPKAYQGFCQAIADANAWLASSKNLKKAGQITQSWLGNDTSLSTATAEVKAQNTSNLLHITPVQWRGSERVFPNITSQPYQNVDWSQCNRIKAKT